MLPDVLHNDLKIVFCGTAAGDTSARLQMYYAGPGNKFWKVLHEVGLTPRVLVPKEFVDLPQYGLGLTDLVKDASGMDNNIDFTNKGTEILRDKIIRFRPRVLCFNGKRAAQEFLSRSVSYLY
jgi:TDG/mug DNA glycosylase family protein